jgi:hypothetical protein
MKRKKGIGNREQKNKQHDLLLLPIPYSLFPVFGEDVRLDLVGVGEAVHQVEQPDDGQHFAQTLIVQTQPLHGGGVRVNSVATVVRRRHGQGDDLLGQEIDFARLHDGLEARPAQA